MAVTTFTTFSSRPLRPTGDRLAKVYDDEVHPLVAARLDALALRQLTVPPSAHVLELEAAVGTVSEEISGRLSGDGRLVILESQSALLDRARQRVGAAQVGRRVFLRQHSPGERLPMEDESFDRVLAHRLVGPLPGNHHVDEVLRDLARVTKPGGELIVTAYLRGSWAEPVDILAETLDRLGRTKGSEALAAARAAELTGAQVVKAIEAAGFSNVQPALENWELLFRTAREFFYSPAVEQTVYSRWKDFAALDAGKPNEVFFAMKDAIELYFGPRPFAVTFCGGCFSARRNTLPAADQS